MAKHKIFMIYTFLTVATLMAFWQVNHADFINYDDPNYITENSHILNGMTRDGIRWAFTTGYQANWHPLTWLSHMLDVQLYGLKPQGHHLTNLLFHIANTLLLFFVLRRMTNTLWQSAFVAALFALHPLHVESVAWVAERKDVLSAFFWIVTMGAYCFYVERPGTRRYLLVLLLFVLGLTAKPMLVTLPFVLLLLDFWPLQRYRQGNSAQEIAIKPLSPDTRKGKSREKNAIRIKEEIKAENSGGIQYPRALIRQLIWEKTPFFAATVLSSIVTYIVQQQGGAVKSVQAYPLQVRLENAFVSYAAYLGKMIWPVNLAVFYPHPGFWQRWQVYGAILILAAITLLVFRAAKRFQYLTVGWLWYLGTLVPVIGIVQVGAQARADRYTYIPLIGLFIMTAWAVPEFLRSWRYRGKVLIASSMAILACCFFVTRMQVGYWANNFTLYDHALNVTGNNSVICYNRGNAYAADGRPEQAIEDFGRALEINPGDMEALVNRGSAYAALGDQKQAMKDFDRAIEIDPDDEKAYYNRGNTHATLGDQKSAIQDYDKAIRIRPAFAAAYYNRGNAYLALGDQTKALADFDKAIGLDPYSAKAYYNRGYLYATLGNPERAITDFDSAIEIDPSLAQAYSNRAASYNSLGKFRQAIESLNKAIALNPEYALAYKNRGDAYAALGNPKQASADYNRAIEIDPRLASSAHP